MMIIIIGRAYLFRFLCSLIWLIKLIIMIPEAEYLSLKRGIVEHQNEISFEMRKMVELLSFKCLICIKSFIS
jgi:hypothetical protein